jgi:hypothetical protein
MINFIINTNDKLKQKMDLISNLVDIKVAYNLRSKDSKKVGNKKQKLEPSPIDQNYENLKCKIEALEKNHQDYKMLEKYVENTSRGTKLQVLDCFKI